jgi:hypothetical protein
VEEQEQVEMEDAAADAADEPTWTPQHKPIDAALALVEAARTAKVVRVSGIAAFAAADAACTAWAAAQAEHRLQEAWGAYAHCEHAAAAVWAKYAVGKLGDAYAHCEHAAAAVYAKSVVHT